MPTYQTSNFLISQSDPKVIYKAVIGTYKCCGGIDNVPSAHFREQANKLGFNSQIVLYKIRVTNQKDLALERKYIHRFFMQDNGYLDDYAADSVLKESADGTVLIFSYGRYCASLTFDLQTLLFKQVFQKRVDDILGKIVVFTFKGSQSLSNLDELEKDPKPLSLEDKIKNDNLEGYIQSKRFLLYEGKYFSLALAKFKDNVIKVFRFQVGDCEISGHEEMASFKASIQINANCYLQAVTFNTFFLGDDNQTIWVNLKGTLKVIQTFQPITDQEFQTNSSEVFMVFQDKNETKLVTQNGEDTSVEVLTDQLAENFKKLTSFAGTYALIDKDHVVCSSYGRNNSYIEQNVLEVFSLSKGEVINSRRMTRQHNVVRNDPFFALESFENVIEFHSLALPKTYLIYELPLEEKLVSFADAVDEKDIEETRAFYLIVEKEGKLWLRRILMTHDKIFGEEELGAKEVFSFEAPKEHIDHAVFLDGKLYLKSENQILVANEGPLEFPRGLKFRTNLVFKRDSDRGGFRCLGELNGVIQDISIIGRSSIKPDPNANGIGSFSGQTIQKVYTTAIHFESELKGYLDKKPFPQLKKGVYNCSIGFRDIFQHGFQAITLWSSSPDLYSEETLNRGKEQESYCYNSQQPNEGSLLMVTPKSVYAKYLEISRSLKGTTFKLKLLGFQKFFSLKNPKVKENKLLVGQLNFNTKTRLALYTQTLQFLQFLEINPSDIIIEEEGFIYALKPNSLIQYELLFEGESYLLTEKVSINLQLEAEEQIQNSFIKQNLLIFKNKEYTLFYNFKTGRRTKIDSSNWSLGRDQVIFFLEQDQKTLSSLVEGQVSQQVQKCKNEIKSFVVEPKKEVFAFVSKEEEKWFIQAFELLTLKQLNKIEIDASLDLFVQDSEIFYEDSRLQQFKSIFDGKFKKHLSYDPNQNLHHLSPCFQTNQDSLIVKAPAIWHQWDLKYLEAKMKNQEKISIETMGNSISIGRFDGNIFRAIGFDKNLLKQFAEYYIQKAEGEELKLLFDLFKISNENEQPIFYQALEKDKLVVDIYLKMLSHAETYHDFQDLVIRNEKDFAKMLPMKNFLIYMESVIKYPQKKETIIQAAWSVSEERILIASSNEVPPKDFQKKFDENFGKDQKEIEQNQTENVIIEVLELDFIKEKGGVAKLFKIFCNHEDEKIFRNKTIDVLVNRIWSEHYPKILKFMFLPYLIYAACFIGYMTFCFQLKIVEIKLENKKKEETIMESVWLKWPLLCPCIVYSCLQLYFEYKQMKKSGSDYFLDQGFLWNFLDLTSSFFVMLSSVLILGGINVGKYIVIIGGIACFVIWLKLFYYLRIFRSTSSFIRMIIEMFKDIRVFLLIFFIGIFAFANFYYILDQGNKDKVVEIYKGSYIGAVIYTYMQALGELGFDRFGESDFVDLYWVIFFFSTVLLTITMLNLLIAIMGDTYDRVQEVTQEAQVKEICSFIDEYAFLFPEEEFLKAPITIIARLESAEEEEGNAWEGKIGALKTYLGKQLKHQEDNAQKERKQNEEKQEKARFEAEIKMEKLKIEIREVKEEVKVRHEEHMKENRDQMKEIKDQMNEIKDQMNEIKALLMSKHFQSEKESAEQPQ